jgi:hypothetical protein
MGINSVISTQKSFPDVGNTDIEGLDPTTIIRLHSILSRNDIFKLTAIYDYNAYKHTDLKFTLRLPDVLINLIQNIRVKNINNIAGLWCSSKEIRINDWTLAQTQKVLLKLISFCKTKAQSLYIHLTVSKIKFREVNPPF